MSGDPVDASGQYNNIFERCIIILNHIYIKPTFYARLYMLYIKLHLYFKNMTLYWLYFGSLTYNKTVVELRPADRAMSGRRHKGYL